MTILAEVIHMNERTGRWLGWIGIALAIIGFFYAPVWMGSIAVILGLVRLATSNKGTATRNTARINEEPTSRSPVRSVR
jgi:hypothetical protein